MAAEIISKRCYKCKQVKPTSEFSKESSRKDGSQTACKRCKSMYHKEYRVTDKGKQKHREGSKKYQKTKKGKQTCNKAMKKWDDLNPSKVKAKNAVNYAVQIGKIPHISTQICKCGNQANHWHHHKSYEPECRLDVVPVCRVCHRKIHSNNHCVLHHEIHAAFAN